MLNKLEEISTIYKLFYGADICKYLKPDKQTYFCKEINSFNEIFERIKNEFSEIEKDGYPLKIGVVGAFNAGKSSLINNIIGEELLQVNLEPTTAIVSIIKYGEEIKIKINYKNGEKKYIDKSEFEHISNHNYDGNGYKVINDKQHDIEYIEIFYPLQILRNLNLIDTPGFSSISESDDRITRAWLKKVDILLWISDVNKGTIDGDELKLLNEIRIDIKDKDIIGIINKIDTKPPFKREKLIKSYSEQFNFNMIIPYSTKEVAYAENIEKLKEYLLYSQNNVKTHKLIKTNYEMNELYNRQIGNLQTLERNIKGIIDIKFDDFSEVFNISDKFINGFNKYFNISLEKLKKDLLDKTKAKECVKLDPEEFLVYILEVFKSKFNDFYEDKVIIFSTFIDDNNFNFNYNYSSEKDRLEFLCDQIIQASSTAAKATYKINRKSFIVRNKNIIKEIIEGALPSNQLNTILQKFYYDEIINLRKDILIKTYYENDELYNRQIGNLQILKLNIKDIEDIKFNDFSEGFNKYLNLSFEKLKKDLLDKTKGKECVKFKPDELLAYVLEIFKSNFNDLYEDKLIIFSTFIDDNNFNYNYNSEKDRLEFLCNQTMQASSTAAKAIYKINKQNFIARNENIIKEIIERALPSNQLNSILQKFYYDEIINLRKDILNKNNEINDLIEDLVKNIVEVLV